MQYGSLFWHIQCFFLFVLFCFQSSLSLTSLALTIVDARGRCPTPEPRAGLAQVLAMLLLSLGATVMSQIYHGCLCLGTELD